MTAAPGSALARKLQAARHAGAEAGAPEGRTLRLAAARAGRRVLACDITATGLDEDRADRPEALEALLAGSALVLRLDGGAGPGLAALDAGAVAAIALLRTVGVTGLDTLARTPPRQDPATPVEAALARPYLDDLLAGWHAALGPAAAAVLPQPLHCGPPAVALRAAVLGLPQGAYRVFLLDLDIAGRSEGRLRLALPKPLPPADPVTRPEDWAEAFRGTVLDCPAGLEAELCRITLPLARLRALRPGMQIALPADSLGAVALRPPGRAAVAAGRLGQVRGLRAVRLTGTAPPPPGGPRITATQAAGFEPARAPSGTDNPAPDVTPPEPLSMIVD